MTMPCRQFYSCLNRAGRGLAHRRGSDDCGNREGHTPRSYPKVIYIQKSKIRKSQTFGKPPQQMAENCAIQAKLTLRAYPIQCQLPAAFALAPCPSIGDRLHP